jgi:hypothetical protein
MKLTKIFESLTTFDCSQAKVTPEIAAEVNKFGSDEELLRAGGISHDALDRAAFGFSESDIKTLIPKQLKIKWKDDWENVKWEQEKSGLSKLEYAKRINLSEPIDVVYEKNHFYVDDGHHRLFAAMILKKPLNVNLEIHQNPILSLGIPDYDQYHRCVFNKIKNAGK